MSDTTMASSLARRALARLQSPGALARLTAHGAWARMTGRGGALASAAPAPSASAASVAAVSGAAAMGKAATGASSFLQQKASKAGPLISYASLGQPVWSPRDYNTFAREGFMQNAIVYRAVRMIAEAAASVPLCLYRGDEELFNHPLAALVSRPNREQCGPDLFEAWYGYLLVSGNAYIEAVALDGNLRELHVLRPDRMKVVPGANGWPEAYDYSVGGRHARFSGEVTSGVRPILHQKLFHPSNDHYGLSPIEAAASAIDIHNAASAWNKALLDNSARPSGALVYTARDANLSDEQFTRLKQELDEGYQGAANAGRPMLLEGGLDWKSMGLSPKDMDFIEAKHVAAREIALALGVPPMLLGIPGDNTYSNYQEATRTFWRQTVLPLVTRSAKSLSNWLAPAFDESAGMGPQTDAGNGLLAGNLIYPDSGAPALEFRPDIDGIEALSMEREALWARLERTSFLTADEKRAAIGYGPLPEPNSGPKVDIGGNGDIGPGGDPNGDIGPGSDPNAGGDPSGGGGRRAQP